jgi:hypothetical protein
VAALNFMLFETQIIPRCAGRFLTRLEERRMMPPVQTVASHRFRNLMARPVVLAVTLVTLVVNDSLAQVPDNGPDQCIGYTNCTYCLKPIGDLAAVQVEPLLALFGTAKALHWQPAYKSRLLTKHQMPVGLGRLTLGTLTS